VFVHSTGVVHDRAGYLDFVSAGPAFLAVDLRDVRVRLRGATAVITGTLGLTLLRRNEVTPVSVEARAMQVWHGDAGAWRLVAAQSTKPAPAPAEAAKVPDLP
jgi:hypothetical protein